MEDFTSAVTAAATAAAIAAIGAHTASQPSSQPCEDVEAAETAKDASSDSTPYNEFEHATSPTDEVASPTPEVADHVTENTYQDVAGMLLTVPQRKIHRLHLVSFGRLSKQSSVIASKMATFTDCEAKRVRLNDQDGWTNKCWGMNGRILLSVALNPVFHGIVSHAKLAIYREAWGII